MKPARGFTLVELMVVITIISLLSSIVLASLNSARIKANNAKTIELVLQYRNALELARLNNGSYPQNDYRCLANSYNAFPDHCWDHYFLSQGIIDALTPYIPSFPKPPVVAGIWDAILYFTCNDTAGPGLCATHPTPANDAYSIEYVLEGAVSCGPGISLGNFAIGGGSSVTYCLYQNK